MYKFFKRMLDILFSFFALIFLAFPMLIIAIIIKCDSPGPALFKGKRVGRNGQPFACYKFRSMRTDAPKDCAPALLDSDQYITKVGKFLRKSSLDELPQLFCILTGKMSLIGPRPSGYSEEELNALRAEKGVSALRPGLTGWAQVNGRDVTASDIEKKVAFDVEYMEKMSFAFDCKIFFMTIGKVLRSEGVEEGSETQNRTKTTDMSAENVMVDGCMAEVAADVVDDADEQSEQKD